MSNFFKKRFGRDTTQPNKRRRNQFDRQNAGYQALEPRKLLASLTVDTVSDVVDLNDGLVSLREAITAANTNAVFGDAPAGDATGDTIQFASNLAGQTITLAGGELEITDDLIIRGNNNITINGNDESRLFGVDTSETVVFSRLTFTSGLSDEGGALLTQGAGTVRLFETTFTSNAVVAGPSGEGNGGAVANLDSRLIVSGSLFENNSASGDGGAIYSEGGSINFSSSTISNNSAQNGGGLAAQGGNNFFANATIEQNEAVLLGGGLSFQGADTSALFIASTIDQNSTGDSDNGLNGGGGIRIEDGQLSIFGGTVISNNTVTPTFQGSGSGGGISSRSGNVRIGGSEIFGNLAAGTGGGISISNAALNVTGSEISDNTAEAGGGISVFNVDLNLQSSLFRRNSASNPTLVEFPFSQGGALQIRGDSTSRIVNSSFQFNTANNRGGAIFNASDNTTIISSFIGGNSSLVSDSQFNGAGGGIFNDDGQLTINSTTIQNNRSLSRFGEGGGIHSEQGSLNINFSSILRNSATLSGGGIAIFGGEATLFETNVGSLDGDGNRAGISPNQQPEFGAQFSTRGEGGGIYAFNSDLTVFGGVIANNVANTVGAGVYSRETDVIFRAAFGENDTMVIGNRALQEDGGGLFAFGGNLNLVDAVFEENTSRNGAGIFATEDAELRLAGSVVQSNEARRSGGGLFIDEGVEFNLDDVTIEANSAVFGPDVFEV